MAQNVLGNLFGSGITDKIVARIDDQKLTADLSAGAYETKPLTLDVGKPVLTLFDTAVNFTANIEAKAKVLAASAKVQTFDDTNAKAPTGTRFTELDVNGSFGATAHPNAQAGPIQLSGAASVRGGFSYRHVLPVAAETTRLAAFGKLVRTAQLPQLVDVKKLVDGESLDFEALINVDFGLTAKYGAEINLHEIVNIARDLSAPISAHAQFSINAAFGLSLYERIHVTAARTGQRNEGWVRIRLERSNRRSITAGAAFALAADYDAAAGLNLLLDQIFARIPMPEVVTNLEEALDLADDWDNLTATISSKAAAFVTELVGDTGWKNWLKDSHEVGQFVAAAKWIVDEYGQIDAKVRSVYEELLSRLDAGGFVHFREQIHRVATFDTESFDVKSVTDGKLTEVITLVETLSGNDVEELLISGSVKEAIEEAQRVAKEIETLIDNAPDKAIDWINGFMQRTGVAGVVEWLENNATVDSLEKAGDAWIGSTIERLVGKALSQISADDVKKLRKFAAALKKVIAAPEQFKKRIRNAVSKLKGTFGISLSLEWSRVSEFAAVVDFEIDPTKTKAVNAVAHALPSGNVHRLLDALTAIESDKNDHVPYEIRDLILTSRHMRTSATTLVISFLGLHRNEQSRIDDTTIRIEDSKRRGIYLGGSVVRMTTKSAHAEGSAWLRHEGLASKPELDKPYDGVTTSLRLAYAREDTSTNQIELNSIVQLLTQLGFPASAVSAVPAGMQTRFAMEIELPEAAFDALVRGVEKDEANWNVDLRNAACRWFGDSAADWPAADAREMAIVLRNAVFGELWINPTGEKFRDAARGGRFGVNIFPSPMDPMKNYKPEYRPLQLFVAARANRFSGFKTYSAPSSTAPIALTSSIVTASKMFATDGTELAPVPLLNLLLTLARIGRVAPAELNKARGLATFRSRKNDTEAWSEPLMMMLGDQGISPMIMSEFPISV